MTSFADRVTEIEALAWQQHAADLVLALCQMPQAIFRNDDRAVDDQAEVECAKTHQIGAQLELEHAHGRDQHGGRNHQRGDECGAEIAEQQEQNQDHQQRALGEVRRYGPDGCVDQLGAVQDGANANAGRQGAADLLDLRINRGCDRPAVAADQHQHRPEHRLVAVDAGAAEPQIASDGQGCDVLEVDRHVVTRRDDDVADLLQRLDPAAGAHHVALTEPLDIIGPAACIVGLDRADQLVHRQAVADELRRVGLHLILLDVAADGVGARDPTHGLQLRPDDPVLYGAQIDETRQVVGEALPLGGQVGAVRLPARDAGAHVRARRRIFDGPPIDLAEARRDRAHFRLDARRQLILDVGQTLGHLLTGKVNVGPVGEHGGDLGKTVARERPRSLKARCAGQRHFDWKRDLLLDFERRQGRCEGIDLDLYVGDVRYRVDRQHRHRPAARDCRSDREQQYEPAPPNREG